MGQDLPDGEMVEYLIWKAVPGSELGYSSKKFLKDIFVGKKLSYLSNKRTLSCLLLYIMSQKYGQVNL